MKILKTILLTGAIYLTLLLIISFILWDIKLVLEYNFLTIPGRIVFIVTSLIIYSGVKKIKISKDWIIRIVHDDPFLSFALWISLIAFIMFVVLPMLKITQL